MPELRLLYVIDGLGPGGAERSLAELLPRFLAEGIQPVVVCLRKVDRGVEADIAALGCEIRILPPGGLMARARALRRMMLQEEVDLVHTTLFRSDIIGRLAAAGTGVPVLTSLVNTTYDPRRHSDPNVRRLSLWGIRLVDSWTARNLTTHFHAITHAVKDAAVQSLRIPPVRISVVERGRDRARLGLPSAERRMRARRRLGLPDHAEVIVNVARQEFQKGQKHLLEAVGLLARERPRLVAVIAGREGHSSSEVFRLREHLELGDRVRVLGHRDDVPEILAASDVFVFPSVYEGLGGAVIEAMALGLPVVASDLPALREVLESGKNALLVQPGSATDLAAAIATVLDDRPMAARFGERGMQIFEERFTIERSATRMIELYRQVAGESRTRSSKKTASNVQPRALSDPRRSVRGA